MALWFTSDNHFSHRNIIQYCCRPFPDVAAMDEEMVRRWNEVVRPQDEVIHLGDFSMGPVENIGKFRARLNGTVMILPGNHDRGRTKMEEIFGAGNVLREGAELVVADFGFPLHLHLSHRPLRDFKAESNHFNLHGHVHTSYRRRGNRINVGVDQWDFRPVGLVELLACKDG
jgi:calcineurin-like phosphoesterase family protein